MRKVQKIKKEAEKTFLSNVPNFLTIARVLLTVLIIYMIFSEKDIGWIITLFVVAALTDLFDGMFARWFGWESEFGRQADMIADRFLWIGTALAITISFSTKGIFEEIHLIQILLIMSREIISGPFALIAFFRKKEIPQARYIAKVNTFIQGFSVPLLILSVFYLVLIYVSLPLAIINGVLGTISGLKYIEDVKDKKY